MIGRSFLPSRFNIHVAGRASFSHAPGSQHEINAQTHFAAKRVHAVVPPAENAFLLFEQAERIRKPRSKNRCSALRSGCCRGSFRAMPGIMDILILGRDIEVAHNHGNGVT
jgi:hypothetical protein